MIYKLEVMTVIKFKDVDENRESEDLREYRELLYFKNGEKLLCFSLGKEERPVRSGSYTITEKETTHILGNESDRLIFHYIAERD